MQTEVNISPFLDEQGRVTALPRKLAKCKAVLTYLAEKFEPDRIYTEKEVNQLCLEWHTFHDHPLVRRSLVDAGLLRRTDDGTRYWRGGGE